MRIKPKKMGQTAILRQFGVLQSRTQEEQLEKNEPWRREQNLGHHNSKKYGQQVGGCSIEPKMEAR